MGERFGVTGSEKPTIFLFAPIPANEHYTFHSELEAAHPGSAPQLRGHSLDTNLLFRPFRVCTTIRSYFIVQMYE
jgi:hypothetical protein